MPPTTLSTDDKKPTSKKRTVSVYLRIMGEKMLVLLLVGALGVILPDLVAEVPFLPDTPNFKTYSGYLDIPNSKGKSLHYVLVES